ncbi:MAG: sugar ABC transporter permease, partial [Ruthenibacterium sp.]
MLPSFLGVCVFVLAPFAETVRRSFTDTLGKKSVGFANYAAVVQNAAFQLAASNTVRFLCICVPLLLLVSLAFALLVRRAGDGARVFKTSYLMPMAVPVASIVLLWKVLFDTRGLLNGLLVTCGAAPV